MHWVCCLFQCCSRPGETIVCCRCRTADGGKNSGWPHVDVRWVERQREDGQTRVSSPGRLPHVQLGQQENATPLMWCTQPHAHKDCNVRINNKSCCGFQLPHERAQLYFTLLVINTTYWSYCIRLPFIRVTVSKTLNTY